MGKRKDDCMMARPTHTGKESENFEHPVSQQRLHRCPSLVKQNLVGGWELMGNDRKADVNRDKGRENSNRFYT